MDKYYYTISQLPLLYFDRETYMTPESFFREVKKWVSKRDLRILSQVRFDAAIVDDKSPAVLQKYQRFERNFRSELARWRESRHSEQEYKPSSFPPSMVKEGNPLEIEKKMLEWRWNFIEDESTYHYFDLEFLILYLLKLQLLEKLSQYQKDRGLAEFRRIVSLEIDHKSDDSDTETITNDDNIHIN